MTVYHEEVKLLFPFFFMNGREEHTAGVDAHHLPWRKVYDGNQRLSYQFFRFIVGMNAGENDAVFSCAVVQSELQELLALGHCFAGLDFDSAEIRLAEGIEIYLVLE